MWNRTIYVESHNLTSLTNRGSYEFLWITQGQCTMVTRKRWLDEYKISVPIMVAFKWSLVGNNYQGMQSKF